MIAVVGGGIIGLATAWRLVQAGVPVTVLERGEVAREATWAAAGYLMATPGCEPFARLTQDGCAAWAEFAAELEAATGLDLDYRSEGAIHVAYGDGADALRAASDHERQLGPPVAWLDRKAVHEAEPALGPEVTAGLYDPGVHWVDNRAAGHALAVAVASAGGIVRTRCPVEEILIERDRVVGVRADGERIAADVVILAAGAWVGELAGVPPAARVPTVPVKGQMLAVQTPAERPLLRHLIKRPSGGAVVPRTSGRIIIGTTVEQVGFDRRVMAGTVAQLITDAARALPGLLELPLIETWAGLRPFVADRRPALGRAVIDGLLVATGLGAHGIMSAPAVASGMAALVLDRGPPAHFGPLGPTRFGDGDLPAA